MQYHLVNEQGEEDALIVRHHPILFFGRAWFPLALVLAGTIAIITLATAPVLADRAAFALVLWLAAAVFLAGALWAGHEYLRWGGDLLYLTEHRLVLLSGIPRINERRRELRIDRIESVEIDQRNPVMRWCGCADLVVAVAGGSPLRYAAARAPVAVRDYILAHLRDRQQVRATGDAAAIRASVARLTQVDDTPLLPEALRQQAQPPRPRPAGQARSLFYFGKRIAGEVWQRHPWFLARAAVGPAILLLAAVFLPFALDWIGIHTTGGAVGVATLVGVVAALLWLGWEWGNWRNDYYVVTPERLIAIDQLPLGLRQQISETALDKVQDIGYRIPHPWALLLDYGDVIVNTASDSPAFVLRGIVRPRRLADRIDYFVAARKLADQHSRHTAMRAEFAQWLAAYDEVSGRRDEAEEVSQRTGERAVGER